MRSLPRVVSNIPSDLRNFLDRVREYLGEGSDNRFVTLGELKKGGIVGVTPGGSIVPPGEYGVQDPAMPRNLTATGAFAVIFLEWDPPNYLGHSHTEVWAADTDDFTTKILVGTTEANSYGHEIGTGATKYYWIRFVNTLGTVGPFNSTAGTPGTTSQDPDYLIQVLSDAYGVTGPAPFFQIDTPTVINGVTIPAGTYIKQAWIADATISRAKIQDLAVDNAKINDLAVNKLTAGTMQVGSYIQSQSYVAGTSGWKINSDGSAEFATAVIRGTIYGGGATSYASGTGLFAGFDSSVYKFRVGNPAGNQLSWNGSSLSVTGTISGSTITGSEFRSGSATGYTTGPGFWVSGNQFRIGDPNGAYLRWTGTALELSSSATSLVNTPNVASNAISNIFVNYLQSTVAISNTEVTTSLPSFTVPTAGKVLVTIVRTYHNFSTGTNYDIQSLSYINGSFSGNPPITRCFSSGSNSNFVPLPPNNTTAGNSVQLTEVYEATVSANQTCTVQLYSIANASNSVLYLIDASYVAILLKK